ncbi:MAG TPA: acyclic terpene utilization AtuA family protein [Frankiaceae bacterium]|nr:acyclic terpene utilization AtuA family protein [Frankiaceae bacterium]
MDVLRVGNCSGFYGDRLAAMREMLDGGDLDVLTGDYLAELTMLILWRGRLKDPAKGYATTFVRQLEDCLGLAVDKGVKVVVNAGGLNPAGCATAVRDLAARLGVAASVAHVEGDDLMPSLGSLSEHLTHLGTGAPLSAAANPPVSANAYLGCWGIVEALRGGADIVVTGRVTDAALVCGPAAWRFGWGATDYDALAGAVVAGHVLECGTQATGGNYAFFGEVPGMEHVGFPLAEIAADGSSVISKHPGSGGLVSPGTVTAQLLYEIGGSRYLGPDVVARFDTIALSPDGPDRVRISGVRGEPPPETLKVALNLVGGFRNAVTFVLTGLDLEAKADLVTRQMRAAFPDAEVSLSRTDVGDPLTNEAATAHLRVTVKDSSPDRIGRAFSSAAVELGLASYPGFTMTAPPGDATPYGVYWPALVPRDLVTPVVVHADGTRAEVPHPPIGAANVPEAGWTAGAPDGPTEPVPLGRVVGARSGDKGGTANLGVWVRDPAAFGWLVGLLTVERLQELLPETAAYPVVRHVFANLAALNFEIPGLLGEGVSSSTRADPQAKGLGEWLRARVVEVPATLL